MVAKGKFQYGTRSIPMEMGFVLANGKMEDLGLDVLSVLSDGGVTLQKILLDDKTMLKVWYYYVHEETRDDWETALAILDETPNGLEDFRDAFYKLVVNFSPLQTRKLLGEMWEQIKKRMKDSRSIKSLLSSSDLLEESESTQATTLSES